MGLVRSVMRACFPPYRQALETNVALKAENARLQEHVEELDRMRLRINVSRRRHSPICATKVLTPTTLCIRGELWHSPMTRCDA